MDLPKLRWNYRFLLEIEELVLIKKPMKMTMNITKTSTGMLLEDLQNEFGVEEIRHYLLQVKNGMGVILEQAHQSGRKR